MDRRRAIVGLTHRHSATLFALAACAVLLTGASHAPPPSGVWEAVRVNAQVLPMTDRVVGTDGFTHSIRLQSMTIRLHANGRFEAALNYRRAILSKNQKVETQPLLNDVWKGAYTMTGNHFHFVTENQGKQKIEPFDGDASGRRITVAFDYEIVSRKHYVLDLDKNENMY